MKELRGFMSVLAPGILHIVALCRVTDVDVEIDEGGVCFRGPTVVSVIAAETLRQYYSNREIDALKKHVVWLVNGVSRQKRRSA